MTLISSPAINEKYKEQYTATLHLSVNMDILASGRKGFGMQKEHIGTS